MFKFEGINKVFEGDFWGKPFTALSDVTFEVHEGSVVGFLGANGAGKTTSIKILLDFIRPTSGRIQFSGNLKGSRREVLSKIGYLPERPYFYPDLTAKEFLLYIGKLNEIDKITLRKDLMKWSELLKIDFAIDRKLRFFSKGMLQRLGFAAALLNNPELLILDEPLAGLDPIGRKEFKDVMIELARRGKTIFFSSHILHDVEEVCDSLVVLELGKVIYDGDVKSLVSRNSGEDFELKVKDKISLDTEWGSLLEAHGESPIYDVKSENLNKILPFLAENKIEIISIVKKTPSLEEIVYRIEK